MAKTSPDLQIPPFTIPEEAPMGKRDPRVDAYAPCFDYKGMMCSMAAFKEHCAFGFWKGSLILGDSVKNAGAAGQFGRLEKISDLPSKKILAAYVKEAMKLKEEGVKSPMRTKSGAKKPELPMPDYLKAALKKNKKAQVAFDAFSSSHRREYMEWITDAKTEATRDKRMEAALEWISEGKSRNWKYQR